MTRIAPDGKAILEALRRGNDSLWWISAMVTHVELPPDQDGCPVVVCNAAGLYEADGPGGGEVIGLAVLRDGGWHLGCIECCGPVSERDAGRCLFCRRRADLGG